MNTRAATSVGALRLHTRRARAGTGNGACVFGRHVCRPRPWAHKATRDNLVVNELVK